MSKEEKEAVELLENIKDNSWTTKYIMSSDSKNAEILLNLIEKLLRENKKLKETNYLTIYQQAVSDNNGRWRDKIQDMIKELKQELKNLGKEDPKIFEPWERSKIEDSIYIELDILEELLKGE